MTDSSDDTPSDRVKKAMAGKKPVTEAPFKVIEGGKGKARKPRAKKAGAEDPVGSSRVDLQACKLEYSIVSPK